MLEQKLRRRVRPGCVSAFCVMWSVGLGASALAQPINESLKMLPADGVMGDQLGYSIDLDNGLAVIGAIRVGDLGVSSGAVYVFDYTIDALNGAQVHKLLASDGAAGDLFGGSVAIDGGLIGVGSNSNSDLGDYSGAAYLFSAVTGDEIIKLLPFDGAAYDGFGQAIAIEGDLVVVSAPGDDDHGNGSGSVYVFDASIDSFNGTLKHKLLPGDGAAGDTFGYSVAIDGGIVAIGAYRDDVSDINSGSVYLFDASTGLQLHKLVPLDGARDDEFGISVGISDGVVAIGAMGDDDNGSLSGSVYLFDAATGLQLHKLLPGDGGGNQLFGYKIGIDGKYVVGSSINDDDNGNYSGSAYLFSVASGLQIKKLLPSDGQTTEQFGSSIAISGENVAVGAWADADNGTFAGSAYLFGYDCPADINGDGILDNGDINAFIALFIAGSPLADFNGDTFLDNGDINAFIAAFLAGC